MALSLQKKFVSALLAERSTAVSALSLTSIYVRAAVFEKSKPVRPQFATSRRSRAGSLERSRLPRVVLFERLSDFSDSEAIETLLS